MNSPKQTNLFDELPLSADLIAQPAIPGSTRHLDPEQRRFNKLSREVQDLRRKLATLQSRHERLQQRLLQDHAPVYERIHAARVALVKGLDRLLAMPRGKLTRKRREGLESCLIWLLTPLMEALDDPELAAIHDRYNPFTVEESAEIDRALVEGMFGPDALDGFAGGALEDMIAHAQARQATQEAKMGKRMTQKAARLAQAEAEANHAVREVYRNLASQLHPDRETDEAQRRLKTDLMQRVNAAYEKRDLLTLLSLQLEFTQLDAEALAELPQVRIKRYNHALQEQVRALKEETEALLHNMAEIVELPTHILVETTDAVLMQRMDDIFEALRSHAAQIEDWSTGLADPARRDRIVDILLEEMRQVEDEFGIDELNALFLDDIDLAPMPKRRRKARRR